MDLLVRISGYIREIIEYIVLSRPTRIDDGTEKPHLLLGGFPTTRPREVQERTGFEMLIPEEFRYTDPPTEEELRILRELDPDQLYPRAKDE